MLVASPRDLFDHRSEPRAGNATALEQSHHRGDRTGRLRSRRGRGQPQPGHDQDCKEGRDEGQRCQTTRAMKVRHARKVIRVAKVMCVAKVMHVMKVIHVTKARYVTTGIRVAKVMHRTKVDQATKGMHVFTAKLSKGFKHHRDSTYHQKRTDRRAHVIRILFECPARADSRQAESATVGGCRSKAGTTSSSSMPTRPSTVARYWSRNPRMELGARTRPSHRVVKCSRPP